MSTGSCRRAAAAALAAAQISSPPRSAAFTRSCRASRSLAFATMQALQPPSAAGQQPGAAGGAPAAAPAGLEECGDEELFMELAAAAEADEEAGGGSGSGGGGASKSGPRPPAGPRLSWAAKLAAQGLAGAVPPGHQPRQAVLLAPGEIPRVAPPPPPALLAPQAAAAGSGRGVATLGSLAPAASMASSSGAAGKVGFADVGQGTLVERYAGLKVRLRERASASACRPSALCTMPGGGGTGSAAAVAAGSNPRLSPRCGKSQALPRSPSPGSPDQEPARVAHPAARPAG